MRIPLTWPKGTYGLPKPKSGCPKGSNFPWHSGYRKHDTEDTDSNNKWSSPFDLAGPYYRNNMFQNFCMKTKDTASVYNLPWPRGQYCINKKGECPEGLCYLFVCLFFGLFKPILIYNLGGELDCLDSPSWGLTWLFVSSYLSLIVSLSKRP